MQLGCSSLLEVGSIVFVLHPISRCAGEPKVSDIGVFLYSRRAKHGSLLSKTTFLRQFFKVCTAFLVILLDWGYNGASSVVLKTVVFDKLLKSIAKKLWAVICYQSIWYAMTSKL